MARGRKPKSAAQKRLEGNRGKRKLQEGQTLEVEKGTNCPSWLDQGAKNEWTRIAPHLVKVGILDKLSRAIVAAYCCSYSTWMRAQKEVREHVDKHGTTVYRTSTGAVKPIPQIATAAAERSIMLKFATELGITPASRSSVTVPEDRDTKDPLAEFLQTDPSSEIRKPDEPPN